MLSFMLDNTIIMLKVCITNIECLKNTGSTLQIQYILDVYDCYQFSVSKQIPMINKCVCITSIIY